jgi:hypothetical protein
LFFAPRKIWQPWLEQCEYGNEGWAVWRVARGRFCLIPVMISEGSFLNGLSRLRERLDLALFAPRHEVGAYASFKKLASGSVTNPWLKQLLSKILWIIYILFWQI